MSQSRPRVRALILAAVCATSLGLAACGDDDDDTTSTTEAAETTTEATETTETAETTDTGDTSETQTNFTDALRAQLEAAGVQSDQVDCVVDELEGTISDEDIADAESEFQETGDFPQQILDASLNAAQKCLQP